MEILVGGKATVLVLERTSPVRERLQAAIADPRLRIYACSEETQRLKQRLGSGLSVRHSQACGRRIVTRSKARALAQAR